MFCEVCLNDAQMVCSGCKVTRYCTAKCQLEGWKTHKKACKIEQILKEVNEKFDLAPLRPTVGRCTGCNLKFDEDEYYCEDACEECGYQVCESCAADTSSGTCHCAEKNFGNLYCAMAPRWYHTDGKGKPYKGDRHPEPDDEYPSNAFEGEARKCNNCGDVAQMLKKEFC
ncbi:hypothetical protein BDW22DRAFT_1340613 [Trametopsis cervina]|nr:hypothetical protein BDW22DRAFT_1340613 [Trametopsis cervina]